MGLSKRITLGNGIQTNYHRIRTIMHDVGNKTLVDVVSYTSRARRDEEVESGGLIETCVNVAWHEHDYDDALTLADAYAWLKELPEFEGATDVLEA
jgi:hypothetical protein